MRMTRSVVAHTTLSSPLRFTIETADADDQEHFLDVMEMTEALHAQGGYAPFDRHHAPMVVNAIMDHGMTYVARDTAGLPIGMLALAEEHFWYNPGPEGLYLQGMGFWVVPEWRGGGSEDGAGKVGVALLKRAREECEARGMIGLITITDPDRRRKHTPVSLESQTLGFIPLGYTIVLNKAAKHRQPAPAVAAE
jgi:GNAT superfamily N-acetyltransferase